MTTKSPKFTPLNNSETLPSPIYDIDLRWLLLFFFINLNFRCKWFYCCYYYLSNTCIKFRIRFETWPLPLISWPKSFRNLHREKGKKKKKKVLRTFCPIRPYVQTSHEIHTSPLVVHWRFNLQKGCFLDHYYPPTFTHIKASKIKLSFVCW